MKRIGLAFAWVIRVCFMVVAACVAVSVAADCLGVSVPILAWFSDPGNMAPLVMLGPVTVAPFVADEELTAISGAYKNGRFIADDAMPRRPVGTQNFKYRSYAAGTFITIPDTKVSRTGAPNRVEIGFTEESSATIDYGLDDLVPISDINNAPKGYNPEGVAVEFLTQLTMLDREKRVADMLFSTANYADGNKTTLSGTSQFSHASSTPISTIQTGIDACFYRPNKAVMGRSVWSKLSQHADIVAACNRNSGTKGIATRQEVANLFELDQILVGEGWYNSAKPGQTPVNVRVWGKSMLLFFTDPIADNLRGLTFGVTAQWGSKIAGRIEDKDAGLRGGIRVRQGESVRELILANDLGYLIDAAVA